jgi:hypothetical protein
MKEQLQVFGQFFHYILVLLRLVVIYRNLFIYQAWSWYWVQDWFLAGADISRVLWWVLSQVLTGLIMGIRLLLAAKSYQLGRVLATSIDTIVGTRHRPPTWTDTWYWWLMQSNDLKWKCLRKEMKSVTIIEEILHKALHNSIAEYGKYMYCK